MKNNKLLLTEIDLGVNFNGYPLENIDDDDFSKIKEAIERNYMVRLHKNLPYRLVVAAISTEVEPTDDTLMGTIENIKDVEKTKYEQLPLHGGTHDYTDSTDMLKGYDELIIAMDKFYTINKHINPRQLHYVVSSENTTIHLDKLIKG